jgi:predicted O-methyltransferase YrrM
MNKYYKYFTETLNTQPSRDPIFLNILSKFDKKSISILEIGCSRSLSDQSRFGDGWSSLFWAKYIMENGGLLKSCDIDIESINNVKILLENVPINFSTIVQNGSDLLKEDNNYDLIYLDGSDDPQQMLDQIKLCNLNNSYVFCDDFHTKGILVTEKYSNYILYKLKNNHQMALFHKSIQSYQLVEMQV